MNNEVNKVLFIVNKHSGTGFSNHFANDVTSTCRRHNAEGSIVFTEGPGHATTLAKHAALNKTHDIVVAVGGDGTINEVANGLVNTETVMGIIPKGSGNGLGRHLGISMKINKAIESIFNSVTVPVDTFRFNGKLSLNVSGIGFDGHIANLFSTVRKRGLRGYLKIIISEFFRFKEFEATIDDGTDVRKVKAFVIAIANSSQYGNNAKVAPIASICDGKLHVCFIKKVPFYRLDFIVSLFRGRIDQHSFCEMVESKNFKVKLDYPVAFHVDGEPCGTDEKFVVEILPQSLKLLIPASTKQY